jgi:hypothetical protein
MENISIIKHTDNYLICEDYFFNLVLRLNFENSFDYFIHNNLINNKFDEIYFKMPFNILKRILNSIEEGAYLSRTIYLSQHIW